MKKRFSVLIAVLFIVLSLTTSVSAWQIRTGFDKKPTQSPWQIPTAFDKQNEKNSSEVTEDETRTSYPDSDRRGSYNPERDKFKPGSGSQSSRSSESSIKVRKDNSRPINLVPVAGGAVDPETGLFYNDEGGGYYNEATTTFVISDSSARGDKNEPYDSHGNPNYRYEGSSGKKYQYDLSNQADRLEYNVDPGAQIRDRIDPDPRKNIDKGLGQHGGGGAQ